MKVQQECGLSLGEQCSCTYAAGFHPSLDLSKKRREPSNKHDGRDVVWAILDLMVGSHLLKDKAHKIPNL